MYNSDIPSRAELPTSKQLVRSTIIAIIAAAAILVSIVLPAEYAIDPTGIGRALGLAEMGEIKIQLAEEAEHDRQLDKQKSAPVEPQTSLLRTIFAELVIGSAVAQTAPSMRTDETTVTLKPGEGTEVKLAMRKGAKAEFSWTATGGVVNFDMHGDMGGKEKSYETGRGVPGQKGVLTAQDNGNHGWFWRNRGKNDVTIVLKTSGDYSGIKRSN